MFSCERFTKGGHLSITHDQNVGGTAIRSRTRWPNPRSRQAGTISSRKGTMLHTDTGPEGNACSKYNMTTTITDKANYTFFFSLFFYAYK